ncbi:MAG: hypothetical protein CVV25_09005 [Ignavibacteriae bacterium HGW-Ignavibacteriae-4]|jgi:hypothetical protein|nr:MAG: hypothetical protein CVV25_09005 [Ignavibacteriae bacterium HGW-Ignavibacteriae-4]
MKYYIVFIFFTCCSLFAQTQTNIAHLDSGLVISEQVLIDAFEEETGDSINTVNFYHDPFDGNYYLEATSFIIGDIKNVYYWKLSISISSGYATAETDPTHGKYTNCKMTGCTCALPCGPCVNENSSGTCTSTAIDKQLLDGHIGTFF